MATQFTQDSLTAQEFEQIVSILKNGGIGVIPTDTIYGIVGSALKEKTVERIYDLRKRAKDKPMIILISDLKDLELFNIHLDSKQKELLDSIWPNQVSVILPCPEMKLTYLHRGKKSLAFRLPNNDFLRKLLALTGPLVAPSANFEAEAPAMTIPDAMYYFAQEIEFYLDCGKLESSPSTLIEIDGDRLNVLRQGSFTLPKTTL